MHNIYVFIEKRERMKGGDFEGENYKIAIIGIPNLGTAVPEECNEQAGVYGGSNSVRQAAKDPYKALKIMKNSLY